MIRTSADIWSSQDLALMSAFRNRFFTTYPEYQLQKPVDILFDLLKRFDVSWDDTGTLPDDVFSMHERLSGFSFSGNPKYLITTDKKTATNDELLLESMFHEFAHIVLEHAPACAGHSSMSSDPSDFGVFYRVAYDTLFQRSSQGFEHEADLMMAVFLFHPYDEFIEDSWRHPLQVRELARKHMAFEELTAQMLMAHNNGKVHLFYVDADKNCFIQKYIPYNNGFKDFLDDETRLLTDSNSAVCRALRTKHDASADSGKDEPQFHCEAFYLKSSSLRGNRVLVLGTDKSIYEDLMRLATKLP
ncbi:MAG: hypothetical protein IJS01_08075 [Lentisphaeria bacterium]|nr:hypothetical protein [Lentisphaeria bacterium]